MKSGFVSIIGRPNVGKSTLINAIVNSHIAITSDKAGTTRNIIQGVYNDPDTQIVFVDTPGIAKPMNKLGKVLNKQANSVTKDVDAIILVVDAKSGLGRGDKYIISTLSEDIPTILVLNKIDTMSKDDSLDLYPFSEIVPISAKTKENVNTLVNVIKNYLTDNIKYFNDDTITSNSKYFMISEYVREKLFNYLEEEIPHSLTCVTTEYNETSKIINVVVEIIVDRESLKKIIIGKNGELLKKVGMESRKDMESLLGKKVFLELYVKCIKDWRDKESYLKNLGFMDFE